MTSSIHYHVMWCWLDKYSPAAISRTFIYLEVISPAADNWLSIYSSMFYQIENTPRIVIALE